MARKPKLVEEEEEESKFSAEDQLSTYLKECKGDHYNDNLAADYVVSTGSLTFDIETGGGIHPGIIRMSGVSEGGKTSATLAIMFNFLKTVPNARAVYIKSEGRLGKEVQERSGVTFVTDPKDWKDGTCFVFVTNVYETAIGLIRRLVKDNPNNHKYFFVLDSMDALVPKQDLEKGFEDANKVAGGALLTSDFLRKMAVALSARGHLCVMISQVRSVVSINPYEKKDPKLTNASGGNAAIHYSDWILEFQQRFKNDFIWEGAEGKSKKLGHYCKIIFRKSANEKSGEAFAYPIKYGQKNGSIWVEREVGMQLISLGYITKGGKWLKVDSSLRKELEENGFNDIPEQFDGEKNFYVFLEENSTLVEYLYDKFRNVFSKKLEGQTFEEEEEPAEIAE